MKETENYISIMIDGLEKKIEILKNISEFNVKQKTILESEQLELEDFNKTVEEKGKLIENLVSLDSGFEAVYDRVSEDISDNRSVYREQIKIMQKLIAQITELSVKVQSEEARNRELVQDRFGKLKQEIKETRKSNKAVANYYKSMSKIDNSPQFMDQKK